MAPKPSRQPQSWQRRPEWSPDSLRGTELGKIEFVMADGTVVPAGFLRYSERDAWQLVFPGVPMPTWTGPNGGQARLVAFDPESPSSGQAPQPAPIPESPAPIPESKAAPHAAPGGSEGAMAGLADLLGTIVQEQVGAIVSPEQVGELVRAEGDSIRSRFAEQVSELTADLEARLAAAQPIQVVMPERPTVTLEGRQHSSFTRLLRMVVQAGVTPYLKGPAGTGKSTLVRQVAEAMSLPFYSQPCNPQMMAIELTGYRNADGAYVETDWYKWYSSGGVFLLDEVDASHPSTLTITNDMIASGFGSFPVGRVERHPDAYLVTAANTYGTGPDRQYVGRAKLDAATLDRFTILEVDYDRDLEAELARSILSDRQQAERWLNIVHKARANAQEHGLLVIVGTRAVVDGARLLAADFTVQEAIEARITRGIAADQAAKLLAGVQS